MEANTKNLDYRIFEVQENNILGRHLVAARDIEAGEIIIHEPPLIKGPSQITGPVCLTCLHSIDEQESIECKMCGWPLCRNEACHVISEHRAECNWTVHKRKEKVKIKTFITPHRSYECITAIRCLYLKDNNPALWQKLLQLESHCEQRRGNDKYESDRMIIAQFLYRFFKIKETEFSEDDILKICGIIQINGHEIPLTDPPYVAIYEIASMLEHSCTPNTCKTFLQNGDIIIRATQTIQKGDHISICYTDPLWSTINRQEHLILTKFFQCECPRCKDPTELGTYYSGLHCFDKQCTGFLIPHLRRGKRGLPDPEWKCSICRTTEAKSEVNKVLSRIAQDYSMTDKQNTTSCEVFLQHYGHNQLLHHNHYFITDVRLKLAQLYGQTTENDVESLSDATLAQKIKLCRQSLDFASVLYPAEWRIQGVLKFELHAAVAEDARRKMITGRIDPDNLKLQLMESKKWLEETIFYLKYEPDILPEGKIVKQGEKNLIDLESLLMRMYFHI